MPMSSASVAPKNWANLVKAGPGGIGYSPQPEVPSAPQQTLSFVSITQQQQQQAQQQKQAESYGSAVERRQPPPPREQREQREPRDRGADQRERRVSSNNNNDSSSCQLFLGNLPTSATEDELRQMFHVFGKIADLRIHTKAAAKPGGRPVPNYGFITFEDPQSAIKLQDAQVSC
jgi:RNA recognition motif-containing protein